MHLVWGSLHVGGAWWNIQLDFRGAIDRALERGQLQVLDEVLERNEIYKAMSDPVNRVWNNHVVESHERFENIQDVTQTFHRYCWNNEFVPLSDCPFLEQLKKTVLVGEFSRTELSKNKEDFVQGVPDVQGSQTRLEKGVNVGKIVDHGQVGQDGLDSGGDV